LPIHLDAHVQNALAELANAKGMDLSEFVNELLKKGIELIQMGRMLSGCLINKHCRLIC
jgi:inorganic pyrophosphatase/exopolyphosphatase